MGLYENWVRDYGKKVLKRFDEIKVTYNFDNGDEFEIAIATLLRTFLPRRCGVCRGFVITDADKKGDDIIVFDVARFPTLRSLGDDLSVKDYVPVEAVLAYIEAKHTLYVTKDASTDSPGQGSQSLERACRQAAAVKELGRPAWRPPVSYAPAKGMPDRKNPLYSAVLARNIIASGDMPERRTAGELSRLHSLGIVLPDLLAAGNVVGFPVFDRQGQEAEPDKGPCPKPFHCSSTELVTARANPEVSFGVAMVQLMWAIGWIELGDVPWHLVVADAFDKPAKMAWGDPPILGRH